MNNYTDSNVSSQVHLSVNVILGLFSFVVSNWNKMMAQTIVFYTLSAVHCSFNLYESIYSWLETLEASDCSSAKVTIAFFVF